MRNRPWSVVPAAYLGFAFWDLGFLRPRVLAAALIFSALSLSRASAAEVIPPKPAAYFNDYANVVPKAKALELNEKLAQFERETSNQIVVAIYPKMESDSDVFDYSYRVKEQWGVGQKGKNNGAVLFVFVQDRKMYLHTNYGLEGALPDATAKHITEQVIKPRFKAGDYPGGLEAGVNAILQAVRGEYTGTGETVREKRKTGPASSGCGPLGFLIILIVFLSIIRLGRRRGGYGYTGMGGPFISSGWGGGGWSGGSSSSSGGGFSGFSGGGGGGGGGGAGSSW